MREVVKGALVKGETTEEIPDGSHLLILLPPDKSACVRALHTLELHAARYYGCRYVLGFVPELTQEMVDLLEVQIS